MKLRNLRISTRLGIGFSIVLCLLIIVVVLSTVLINNNRSELKSGLKAANTKAALVWDMKSALLQSGIAMRNMLDIGTVQKQKERVAIQLQKYTSARSTLLRMNLTIEEKAILGELDRTENSISPQYKLALRQAEDLNSEGAAAIITKYIDPINMRSIAEIDKLIEVQKTMARKVMHESEEKEDELIMILGVISLLSVIFGAIISWRITLTVTGPINRAIHVANTVASGDFTVRNEDRSHDEVGDLLKALDRMSDSLSFLIAKVRTTAHSISKFSENLASDNIELSSRTESQAASLQETASAMEQLTATVRHNTENALNANNIVQSTSAVAATGGQKVFDVMETMKSVKTSSSKITDIIGVIDGIAFQTNILALNASVEAARAGQHGSGFAVVASEVRSLAHRSANAAKEVKDLILGSVEQVENGSNLANNAGIAMKEVVKQVDHVNILMKEIANGSEEQNAGIEQINKAISQIDEITQQNAKLVVEAADSAEKMKQEAKQLAEAVDAFKLA